MIFSFPETNICNHKIDHEIITSEKNSLSLTNCTSMKAAKTQETQISKKDLISQCYLQFEKENIPQSLRDLKENSIKVILEEDNKIEQMQKSCFALQDKFYFSQQSFEKNLTNYQTIIKQLRKQLASVQQLAKKEKNQCMIVLAQKNSQINVLEKQLCFARNKLMTAQDYSQRLKRTYKQLKKQNLSQKTQIEIAKRQLINKLDEKNLETYENTHLQGQSIDDIEDEQSLSELKQKISQKKIQALKQTVEFKKFYQKQLSELKSQYLSRDMQSSLNSYLQNQQPKFQLDLQSNIEKSELINLKLDLAKVGIQEFSFQSFSPEKMSQNSSRAIQGFSITNILIQHSLDKSSNKSQSILSSDSSQQIQPKTNNWFGYAIFGFGFVAGGVIYTILNKYLHKK